MQDTEQSRHDFALIWRASWRLYDREVNADMLMLAFRSLQRYELEDIERAIAAHINDPDTPFPPKPSDIVKHLDGGTQTRAALAWTKVERAIKHVGAWEDVVFDDPIIQAVITDMGGWIHICRTSEKELPFEARKFEKRYQGYVFNPPRQIPNVLTGRANAQNRSDGLDYQASPTLIGDPEKARQIAMGAGQSSTPQITRAIDTLPKRITNQS